jgi:hypothetical protein
LFFIIFDKKTPVLSLQLQNSRAVFPMRPQCLIYTNQRNRRRNGARGEHDLGALLFLGLL